MVVGVVRMGDEGGGGDCKGSGEGRTGACCFVCTGGVSCWGCWYLPSSLVRSASLKGGPAAGVFQEPAQHAQDQQVTQEGG